MEELLLKFKQSKLDQTKMRHLIDLFVAGSTSRIAADIGQVHKNTANLFFYKIRWLIANKMHQEFLEKNSLNIDNIFLKNYLNNSFFSQNSKNDYLFAIIEQEKKVYTFLLDEASLPYSFVPRAPLILPDAVVYSSLPLLGSKINISRLRFLRLRPPYSSKSLKKNVISSSENFWKQTKRLFSKFNGLPRKNFYLYIKEAEWRYNYGKPKNLLKTLHGWIKY